MPSYIHVVERCGIRFAKEITASPPISVILILLKMTARPFETLVFNHHTTRCINLENYEFEPRCLASFEAFTAKIEAAITGHIV
jgi:hypothetical protein